MNKNETSRVLAILKVAYPNTFKSQTAEDIQALVELWEMQFDGFTYQEVMYAVNSYISTDTSGFYPTVGKIKEMIIKLKSPKEMTEQEAWALVKKALRNGIYGFKEEFEKLPPTIQKLVGSSQQIKEWAMLDSDELNTVVASNFMRSYKARVSYDKEYQKLPNEIKKMLGTVTNKMIE